MWSKIIKFVNCTIYNIAMWTAALIAVVLLLYERQ